MKNRTLFALLAGWLFAAAPAANAQGTGIIAGRVFNAATGEALINARVKIDGTAREAITDDSGSYRLTGVPAGEARIAVTYIGMERESATVNVPAGGTVPREFELRLAGRAPPGDVVKLDAVTVVADREMSAQAEALNERKNAASIRDVVSLDEYGDRKGSIGQFLAFLPGVSLSFSGANPNSASLRGFPTDFTNVSVDGGQMSNSFTTGRGQRLEEVSTINIARVEVTKVPTPDMPASGLGGSINLISRNGFETKNRRFTYDLYGMFHKWQGITLSPGPKGDAPQTSPSYNQPSVSMTLLEPLGKDLAVTLGYSRYWEHKPAESGTKDTDELPTWDLIKLVQQSSQWQGTSQIRIRTNMQAGVDWRISPIDILNLRFSQQVPELAQTRNVMTFNYGAGATGGRTFTQGQRTAVGTVTMNGNGDNNHYHTRNRVTNLKYRHEGPVWRIETAVSYSDSATHRSDTERGMFTTTPAQITGLILRGDGIPDSSGTIPTNYTATTSAGLPVDLYDGGAYAINSAVSNPADTTMRRKTARLDVTRGFNPGFPLSVKAGLAADSSDRDNRNPTLNWTFRPAGAADAASRLARNFDLFDDAFNATGATLFGKRVRWFSGRKLYELYTRNPGWFVLNETAAYQTAANNSREMSETVSAGYLRTDLRLLNNRLWLVTGARYERTDINGAGVINDINAIYRHDAAGNFILSDGQKVLITADPLAQAKLRYQERGAHGKKDYDGLYPSLNLTYNFTDRLLARAAYARTIGRPQISNIIPGTTISAPDVAIPTITVSNPALIPWTANNYDISLESYQIKGGVGSVGLFYKTIANFVRTVRVPATAETLLEYGLSNDPIYNNYEIVTLANSGDAKVRGIEIAYRQSLNTISFLPTGLQVFVNMTKLQLEGTESQSFAGFNPLTYAGGISFVRARYAVKCTFNFQDETPTGSVLASVANGIPPNTSTYQSKQRRLGIEAQYSFNKHFTIYASIPDALGFRGQGSRYAPDTPEYAKPIRYQRLGFFTTIGVRGQF